MKTLLYISVFLFGFTMQAIALSASVEGPRAVLESENVSEDHTTEALQEVRSLMNQMVSELKARVDRLDATGIRDDYFWQMEREYTESGLLYIHTVDTKNRVSPQLLEKLRNQLSKLPREELRSFYPSRNAIEYVSGLDFVRNTLDELPEEDHLGFRIQVFNVAQEVASIASSVQWSAIEAGAQEWREYLSTAREAAEAQAQERREYWSTAREAAEAQAQERREYWSAAMEAAEAQAQEWREY